MRCICKVMMHLHHSLAITSLQLHVILSRRYGVILKKMDLSEGAVSLLCEAVTAEPMLWCAWLELSYLVHSHEMVSGRMHKAPC